MVVAATQRLKQEPSADELKKEKFYTEGTEELKKARLWILHYSLPRAKARITLAKRKQQVRLGPGRARTLQPNAPCAAVAGSRRRGLAQAAQARLRLRW